MGAVEGLARKRGRPGPDAKQRRIAELEAENDHLPKKLETSEKVIEVQGKVSVLLEELSKSAEHRDEVEAMIGPAAVELEAHLATTTACAVLGRSRAIHYRRRQPAPEQAAVTERRRAAQPRALCEPERAEVLSVLHSDRFVDESRATVWATLLDEGTYLASPATM